MDPTYTLKPQMRIKITNIYLDEIVTLIQYIKPFYVPIYML